MILFVCLFVTTVVHMISFSKAFLSILYIVCAAICSANAAKFAAQSISGFARDTSNCYAAAAVWQLLSKAIAILLTNV